ncbi:HEAT repeat protein [Cordyceps militaris CM01]|uniref:HEAT repeat protein n=1 Tax=Cordyceps militaris (strain CM01) TaxID=983644 RepID=G3JQT3_CORMM|nr:HEAT repeat protein [Cordyceps militaris CM01]EGX89109.1 HEAT repeat protein [Cordyceps militaris CM01]
MEAVTDSVASNALFQRLKPCCVEISRLTIRDENGPSSARELQILTTTLLDILQSSSTDLHDKLAEYVFFPLSHIFRQMTRYPMTIIENCVACLRILIQCGWRMRISPALVQQIFTLLVFLIDGVPGSDENQEKPEELILESFRTMTALLDAAAGSAQAAAGLAAPTAIPQLGHGVTAILEGITDGVAPAIQEEALSSLVALYRAIRDRAALATFLPGSLSKLAMVLHTPARYKTSVLAGCLDAVRVILTSVLGDLRTRSILVKKNNDEAEEDDKNKVLGPAWLNATVGQVKKALATMMKLRAHESENVRTALDRLCITLLDECHETLSNCSGLLVETAIILDSSDRDSFTETNLSHITGIYPELLDVVKTTVYDWMSSLPRHMQSADEDVKRIAIHNFSKGIELLRSLHIESATMETALSNTLCETITSLLQTKTSISDNATPIQLLETKSMVEAAGKTSHPPVILSHESQRGLKRELVSLLRAVSLTSQSGALLADMVDFARSNAEKSQVAAYWLSLEMIKAAHASSADDDALLNLSDVSDGSYDTDAALSELYSFSVDILDSHSDASAVDWRMEALALEVVAYASQRAGESFRPELIDVLFPIATFLGSHDPQLQQHAVATLNILASASKYDSVSDLIVSNVDYMLSSVALRLNTLDISPASTKVLTMMIRLAGPRLIPFMDDVVESIFAALDNYHGYPMFVESLFDVLKEIVDQGAKTESMRLLKDHEKKEIHHKKQPGQPEDLNSLMVFLHKRDERRKRDEEEARDTQPLKGHPQTPWGEPEKKDGDGEMTDTGGEPPSEEKPPSSSTYQLLSRVASLTQHYLTSPTPRLRRSLLALLTSATRVLAADEDAFLPLVNTLWPVVIGRLRDPEPYVVVEACAALAGLCAAAGDFLASRFQTAWHDDLREFCRAAKRAAAAAAGGRIQGPASSVDVMVPLRGEHGLDVVRAGTLRRKEEKLSAASGSGLGQHASPARIWAAVVALLTAVVAHVRIEDGMFDDVLELLVDVLDKRPEVREALEVINADAVWLALYERGMTAWQTAPTVEGASFIALQT